MLSGVMGETLTAIAGGITWGNLCKEGGVGLAGCLPVGISNEEVDLALTVNGIKYSREGKGQCFHLTLLSGLV